MEPPSVPPLEANVSLTDLPATPHSGDVSDSESKYSIPTLDGDILDCRQDFFNCSYGGSKYRRLEEDIPLGEHSSDPPDKESDKDFVITDEQMAILNDFLTRKVHEVTSSLSEILAKQMTD